MDCPCLIKREKSFAELQDEEKEFVTDSVNNFSAMIRRMLTYRKNYVDLRKAYKTLGLTLQKEQEEHLQQIKDEQHKVELERQHYDEALKVERANHEYEIQEEKSNNEKYLNKIEELEEQIKKFQEKNGSNSNKCNVEVSNTEDMFACLDDDEEEEVKTEDCVEEEDEHLKYFEDEYEVPCGQRCRENVFPAEEEEEEVVPESSKRNIFGILQDSTDTETPTKISPIVKPVVETKWLSKTDFKRPEQENAAPKSGAAKWISKYDKHPPKGRNSSFLNSKTSTSIKNHSRMKQSKLEFSPSYSSPIVTVTKVEKPRLIIDETVNPSRISGKLKRKSNDDDDDSEELFNFPSRPKKAVEPKVAKIVPNCTISKIDQIDQNETYCPELSTAIQIKTEPKSQEGHTNAKTDDKIEYNDSQSSDVIIVPGTQNEEIIIDESTVDTAEEFLREIQKQIRGEDDNILNYRERELSPTQPEKQPEQKPKGRNGIVGTRLFASPPRTKKDKKLVFERCYCDECNAYVAMLRLRQFTDEEIEQRLRKMGKHRTNKKLHNTPEGFWNPLMSYDDSDDDD